MQFILAICSYPFTVIESAGSIKGQVRFASVTFEKDKAQITDKGMSD